MPFDFHFTYKNLESQYQLAIDMGYKIVTCADYCRNKKEYTSGSEKIIVNRIDVDASVKKLDRIIQIFDGLGIHGSFFLRLHADEYNPFSFESYRIIKKLVGTGHEIGYHSEIVDQAAIWDESAEDCLKRDIDIINRMYGIKIEGVASHGGRTGLNNLDFWQGIDAEKYGLAYEAYDKNEKFNLFAESFYISDSEWTRWKCYDKGKLVTANNKTFGEHLLDEHKLIYLLIHPDTYFENNTYE